MHEIVGETDEINATTWVYPGGALILHYEKLPASLPATAGLAPVER